MSPCGPHPLLCMFFTPSLILGRMAGVGNSDGFLFNLLNILPENRRVEALELQAIIQNIFNLRTIVGAGSVC